MNSRSGTSGLASTGAAQIAKIGIQVISGATLARILSPDDFGVVALTIALTGILNRFKDGGISIASIRIPQIDRQIYSDLYWINLLIGAAVAAICIIAGKIMATVYSDERLSMICTATSAIYLIGATIIQPDASFRRDLRFGLIAKLDIMSAAVTAIAAVSMALAGLGFWSLVIPPIIALLIHASIANLKSPYKPIVGWRGDGVLKTVKEATQVLNSNIISHISISATPIIYGYISGTSSLGIYNRIQSIISIPTTQLQTPLLSVIFTALTKKLDDPAKFNELATRWINRTFYVSVCTSFATALFSREAVGLLLGSNWTKYSPILTGASFLIISEAASSICSTIIQASGRFRLNSILRLLDLIGLSVFSYIGSREGVETLFMLLSLNSLFLRLPFWMMAVRTCVAIPAGRAGRQIFTSSAITLLAYVTLTQTSHQISELNVLSRAALFFIVIAITIATHPGMKNDAYSIARSLACLKKSPKP